VAKKEKNELTRGVPNGARVMGGPLKRGLEKDSNILLSRTISPRSEVFKHEVLEKPPYSSVANVRSGGEKFMKDRRRRVSRKNRLAA